MEKLKPGIYKHFKGDEVEVFYVATHTETKEEYVVYSHNGNIWVRPLAMFLEQVEKPEIGYKGPRFVWVRDN